MFCGNHFRHRGRSLGLAASPLELQRFKLRCSYHQPLQSVSTAWSQSELMSETGSLFTGSPDHKIFKLLQRPSTNQTAYPFIEQQLAHRRPAGLCRNRATSRLVFIVDGFLRPWFVSSINPSLTAPHLSLPISTFNQFIFIQGFIFTGLG